MFVMIDNKAINLDAVADITFQSVDIPVNLQIRKNDVGLIANITFVNGTSKVYEGVMAKRIYDAIEEYRVRMCDSD